MKRVYLLPLFIISLSICLGGSVFAQTSDVIIKPETISQGDPVIITVTSSTGSSSVTSIMYDKKKIPFFMYQSTLTALVGIDLNEKAKDHTLTVTFNNGESLQKNVTVTSLKKDEAPLGIPEKLGGNTATSQKKLTVSLTKENDILSNLISYKKNLWTRKFIYPVNNPIVVDPYGYSRLTGKYTIAHKGTDFRAIVGTKVFAMNRGIVRVAKKSPIYGNMVVIDHGLGLMTMYMHMSKLQVKQGTLVEQGQLLGLSGQTGYALGPHLHLSVRINAVSIDPMKFMALFE